MVIFASQSFKCSADRVLHITHSKEVKTPEVSEAIANVTSPASQVIHIGEHLLTEPRFNYFDTVVLHTCSYANIFDYLVKLKQGNTLGRLRRVTQSKSQRLIILGSALELVSDKVNIIPISTRNAFQEIKPRIDRNHLDTETQGLHLFKQRFDFNFTSRIELKEYERLVRSLTNTKQSMYLLSNTAILESSGEVKQGDVFILRGSSFTRIKHVDVGLVTTDNEAAAQERNLDEMPASQNEVIEIGNKTPNPNEMDKDTHVK